LHGRSLLLLLTHRKLPQSKAVAIDNDLRGTLRNFGLKVGMVGTVKFEGRIRELVENLPDLAVLISPVEPPHQSGHPNRGAECPLLGVKRTFRSSCLLLTRSGPRRGA
jgi:hypothetical protein